MVGVPRFGPPGRRWPRRCGPETGALVSHGTAGVLWGIDGVRGREDRALGAGAPEPAGASRRRSPRHPDRPGRSHHARPDPDHHAGPHADRRRRSPRGRPSARGDGERLPGTTSVRPSASRRGSAALARLGSPRCRPARDARSSSRGDGRPLESRLEGKVWLLLSRSRLPRPHRQHWVTAPGGRYRLDFAWPERKLGLECDGWAAHGDRGWRSGRTASGCRRWWRRDGGCCSSRGTSARVSRAAWFVGSRMALAA